MFCRVFFSLLGKEAFYRVSSKKPSIKENTQQRVSLRVFFKHSANSSLPNVKNIILGKEFFCLLLFFNTSVGVSTPGVPGPTSKLSPRGPAQMGRRETEREGGKSRREAGVKGETRGLRVCPAPRSGALAVGGYKRPRGREREAYARAVPSFPARPTLCKRALDLPFIGVRRGSRCTMGGVAVC
jgi:hypothetical protein